MTHEIKISINDNNGAATLTVDNNTIAISQDIAMLLWNAIASYLNEYCADCRWNSPHDAFYVMGNLRVKIKRYNDEITFTFEE